MEGIKQEIEKLVNQFSPISLQEMDAVELMNRLDTKYFFKVSDLFNVLEYAMPHYRVLEINNKRQFEYFTRYFDTPSFQLYHDHHNGRLNRYKIRQRRYDVTGKEYFEIKFKNNKGQTLKKRIENTKPEIFNAEAVTFLEKNTPFHSQKFEEVLHNRFIRITLDYFLEFSNKNRSIQYSNIAILEIKQDFSVRYSPLKDIMHMMHYNPSGLSKYCTGVVSLYSQQVKTNAFKPILLKISNI